MRTGLPAIGEASQKANAGGRGKHQERAVLDFITESTNPYLNLFRRVTRPIGAGGMAFDVAPILAIFALMIAQGIIVGAILR